MKSRFIRTFLYLSFIFYVYVFLPEPDRTSLGLSCDVNSPVDVSHDQSADKMLVPGKTPYIGELMLMRIISSVRSQIFSAAGPQVRIVTMNGNVGAVVAPRPDAPRNLGPFHDAFQFAAYTGQNFRYRFEVCSPRSAVWQPVTTPEIQPQTLRVDSAQPPNESIALSNAASPSGQPDPKMIQACETLPFACPSVPYDPSKIALFYEISWIQPELVTKAEVKHTCTGIVFQVATNYARASTFVKGHESDGPYPVEMLGVQMHYDGNILAGNHDAQGNPDTMNPFPYGTPYSKQVTGQGFVEVSDQIRGLLINVCSGFRAIAVSRSYDGRTATVSTHTQ